MLCGAAEWRQKSIAMSIAAAQVCIRVAVESCGCRGAAMTTAGGTGSRGLLCGNGKTETQKTEYAMKTMTETRTQPKQQRKRSS